MSDLVQIKNYLERDAINQKFQKLLWDNAHWFLTTVLGIVNSNDLLKQAEPQTIYLASLVSASLKLPINPNFWFAYIVPYRNKKSGKVEAQFQMWYKGFIQLAQRSNKFKTIETVKVYENDTDEDVMKRLVAIRKTHPSDQEVVWFASYFKLLSGFEKTFYMSVDELKKHWVKYSQSYKKWYGQRVDNFDAMAEKTVTKLLLSKYAPLSVDMQTAVTTDQAVIRDETFDAVEAVEYVDNEADVIEAETSIDPELLDYWKKEVESCKTLTELKKLKKENKPTNATILSLFKTHEKTLQN